MKTRKAQGLSFNFIVIVAIALIVMFVVLGIFTSRTREADDTLSSCVAVGGDCFSGSCPDGRRPAPMQECPDEEPNCCI